jgi:capsid assembly protease
MINLAELTLPWMILPAKLQELHSFSLAGDVSLIAKGTRQQAGQTVTSGNISIIDIIGPIMKRLDLMAMIFGGVTYADIQGAIHAALDDNSVAGVVLKIDSPGGTVAGAFELSDFIYQARGKKPIIAYADGMMASSAYLIGSAASKVIAPPSAQVGSIGVINVHTEVSGADKQVGLTRTVLSSGKYKALGNPYEPLSKDGREDMQTRLNYFYSLFIKAVARNRGITEKKALSMADGKIFIGQQALDIGLVDAIGNLDYALSFAQGKQSAAATTVTASAVSYRELVTTEQKRLRCSQQEAARKILETEAGQAAFLSKVRNGK